MIDILIIARQCIEMSMSTSSHPTITYLGPVTNRSNAINWSLDGSKLVRMIFQMSISQNKFEDHNMISLLISKNG